MKAIRIGNDIRIEWPMTLSGDVAKLTDLDLSVEVRLSRKIVDYHNYVDDATWGDRKKKEEEKSEDCWQKKMTVIMNGGVYCRPDIGDGKEHPCPPPRPPKPARPHKEMIAPVQLPYHIEDNKIIAIWTAGEQFALGEYDILLYARKAEGGQAVVDQARFVRLVAHTAQADDPDDSSAEALIQLQPVTLELSGLSAYEVAVVNGFNGTEEEWLASLKKPAEDAAEDVKAQVTQFLEDSKARLDGVVKINELNAMTSGENLAKLLNGGTQTRYVVMDANNMYVEGILDVFADNMGHMITQVFRTHDVLDDDGTFISHTDEYIHTYYRSYHVSGGTSLIPVNTWGAWQPLLPDLAGATFYGLATPATKPQTSKERGFYIATEAGSYANFLNVFDEVLQVEEGEVAVFRNSVDGYQNWSKTTLDVVNKSALQKTVTDVTLSDESDDESVRIDIHNTFKDASNPVKTVTINGATGEKAGVMSATDKADLDSLKKDVWPLGVTFTATPVLMEYTGSEQQINLAWTIRRRGENVTPESINVKQGATSIYSGSNNPGTAVHQLNAKGTTKYDIEVTAEGMTASAQVSVQQVMPMYFGFNAAETATSMNIRDLTKQALKTNPAGTYTLTNSVDGNYMWLCVPDTMTINRVTLNGFDVPMEAVQIGNTTLGNYKCYRSSNALVAKSYTIIIA